MQCLITINYFCPMEWCEQEVSDQEDSLPQETGRAKSSTCRYIILLQIKRTCVSFRPEYGHNGFA